jgi:hypothetical protein
MLEYIRNHVRYLGWGVLILGAHGALAADAPDVRILMTGEEYQAAGMDKLSPGEIEALNRWLVRYTAKEAPLMRQSSPEVREEIKRVDTEITRSRIVGKFTGWSGETVFRLENGQIWKQRMGGTWRYRADSPEVELSKNFMGFWMMRIVEADRAVGVKLVH